MTFLLVLGSGYCKYWDARYSCRHGRRETYLHPRFPGGHVHSGPPAGRLGRPLVRVGVTAECSPGQRRLGPGLAVGDSIPVCRFSLPGPRPWGSQCKGLEAEGSPGTPGRCLNGLTSGRSEPRVAADVQRKRWEKTGVTPGKPGSFTANILVKVVPVFRELKTLRPVSYWRHT